MKKYFLLLSAIISILHLSTANGQKSINQPNDPVLSLGIKAGINLADQTTNSTTNLEIANILRFNGGIYLSYFITKNFGLQPEFLVSGKGVHWKDQYTDGKDLLTYLDIPILIKYQPIKFANIQFGPNIGYQLKAQQKILDTGETNNINSSYKKSDFGLLMGIELKLPFKISVSIRYNLGLTTVTSDQLTDAWKNNFLQFSIGYRLVDLVK